MADMCSCMVTGRLTSDSEIKYVGSSAMLKFSVAVGRYEKGQTVTSFFDVVQWGKAAESLNSRLTKGKPVVVRGEMRQEFWNAQDGAKRSRWVLVADAFGVQPLSSLNQEESQEPRGRADQFKQYDDEDIPF